MRKIAIWSILCIITVSLAGCGKKQEANETIDFAADSANEETNVSETVEYSTDSEGNTYVAPTDADTNPYAEAYIEGVLMKAGELWFMSADDFKHWCSEHYPTIGEHLGSAWEDIDWSLAKSLLYKTTFGSAYPEWADNPEIAAEFGADLGKTPEEIEQEMFNEYAPDFSSTDVLYFAPPAGFVESMSTSEKREYLKEMFVYLYDAENLEIMQKALDAMNDEDIEGMAADMAEAVEKEYPNYTYKKGDEHRKKTNTEVVQQKEAVEESSEAAWLNE